jgi:RND family efflux transporter MFP subunit
VANLAVLEFGANIPAESLGAVRVGQPVTVTSETFPDRPFEGRVVAVAPAVDPATNSALARVLIRNTEGLLRIGMFAQASIPAEEHLQALVVPASAIERVQQDAFVYVLEGDLAERTPVRLGIETPDAAEVLSGVGEGARVLASNVHGLGDKVKVRQVKGS